MYIKINYIWNEHSYLASSDICNQPVGYGIGGENLDRWYFDSTAQTCRKFFYGGLVNVKSCAIENLQTRTFFYSIKILGI